MTLTRRNFLKSIVMAVPAMAAGARIGFGKEKKTLLPPANLDFITDEMDILRRNEWTQVLPKAWLLNPSSGFDRITVHHVGKSENHDTAKNSVVRDLDGVITEHMDRNYGDIGYHFVVDYAGRLWEARSLAYEGAHVSGQNVRNIGIVCVGNFELQQPSEDQMTTVEQIVTVLEEHYGIKQNHLFGHRDLGPTACPGDKLYPRLVKLRT